MNETVLLAIVAAAGIFGGAVLTLIGALFAAVPAWLKARSDAQAVERGTSASADAAAFGRLKESQEMQERRGNTQDAKIDTLRAELDAAKDELRLAREEIQALNQLLKESQTSNDPLKLQITVLNDKILGLETIISASQQLIASQGTQISKLEAYIAKGTPPTVTEGA